MRWLYNILFSIGFWLTAPYLLLKLRRRGEWRDAFGQRFGRYQTGAVPSRTAGAVRLWLHAVSVGEANTCLQFVRCLQQLLPDVDLVVSTTTNTGMAELRAKLPHGVTPVYFPVDTRACVRRALDALRPDAVLLVEREIWPNFLWELDARAIPLFLINARISAQSHRTYRRFGFLFSPLYAQFRLVAAQTDMDARRLQDVGCRPDRLHVCGNMKFDSVTALSTADVDVPSLLARAGRKPGGPVLLAGSTHDGEELLIGRLGQRLRKEFPDLFVVIVPRHFERCQVISATLRQAGVSHVLRTALQQPQASAESGTQTLLVDSTGELTAFYAAADVVFIGKSLSARGGQNPIEPAILRRAIVVGPHMQNFAGVTQQLLNGDGVVRIGNESELESTLRTLLSDPSRRRELGENARRVIDQNTGATQRTADLVLRALSDRGGPLAERPAGGNG